MSLFGNLTKGITSAVTAAKQAADSVAQAAAGSKLLQEYTINELVATAGKWKIYRANSKKHAAAGPVGAHGVRSAYVSLWIIEKKDLDDGYKKSRAGAYKSFADIVAADAQWLSRLKHPGIVKVLEPLEDIRSQYGLVTEEIVCSLHNWLRNWDPITPQVRQQVRELALSELEIKNGINHVIDTLTFLHSKGIVHCNLSPQSILVTADGVWKLAGLGFTQTVTAATSADAWGAPHDRQTGTSYTYDSINPAQSELLSKPLLQYTAPELVQDVRQQQRPLSLACDVFSLGCVVYEVLSRQPMLTALNTSEYRGFFASAHMLPMSQIPSSFQAMLRQMISENPLSRPPVTAIVTAPYFADDLLLRALRFVETMLQRDLSQKQAFMRDLPTFMHKFGPRVARLRVLPVLLDECRNDSMRAAVIPIVLQLLDGQTPEDFQNHVLPHLRLVLQIVHGAQLIEIINVLPKLQALMRVDQVEDTLIPMLMQALEKGDNTVQEEVMRSLPPVLEKIGTHCLHDKVLLRLHDSCLRTSSSVVRVGALRNFAKLAPRLTAADSEQLVKMVAQLTGIDKSAATIVACVTLAEAIARERTPEHVAQVILPALVPLLVCDSLTVPQFRKAFNVVKDLLGRIEEKVAGVAGERASTSQAATKWDEGSADGGTSWRPPPEAASLSSGALQSWESPAVGASRLPTSPVPSDAGGPHAGGLHASGGPPMRASGPTARLSAGGTALGTTANGGAVSIGASAQPWNAPVATTAAALDDPFAGLGIGSQGSARPAAAAANPAASNGVFYSSTAAPAASTLPPPSSFPFAHAAATQAQPNASPTDDPFGSFAMPSAAPARPSQTRTAGGIQPSRPPIDDMFGSDVGLMSAGGLLAGIDASTASAHGPVAPLSKGDDPFSSLFDAAITPRSVPATKNVGPADPFANLADGSLL